LEHERIRVLIANATRIWRDMLYDTIREEPDIEVVGDVSEESVIVSATERTNPDCLIVPLDDSGHAIPICTAILTKRPHMRIVAIGEGTDVVEIYWMSDEDLDFQNLFQLVPVEPGTHYHFSAYLRSQAISTDHGVHFEMLDAQHPVELQVVTPDAMGTIPWILQQTDFVTGPNTHLLRISLRRIPSWKFDNKLGGTVWVDDVTLTPIPGVAKDIS
jgi:hypothetical protein